MLDASLRFKSLRQLHSACVMLRAIMKYIGRPAVEIAVNILSKISGYGTSRMEEAQGQCYDIIQWYVMKNSGEEIPQDLYLIVQSSIFDKVMQCAQFDLYKDSEVNNSLFWLAGTIARCIKDQNNLFIQNCQQITQQILLMLQAAFDLRETMGVDSIEIDCVYASVCFLAEITKSSP